MTNPILIAIFIAIAAVVATVAVPTDPFNPSTETLLVHVDKSGNDSVATGTLDNPFLTIQAALASITDASTTKRYALTIGSGRFDETGTIYLKPWVWLIGTQRTATRVTATAVNLDSSFTNGNYRAGFQNILFSGSTNVILDLQSLGGSGSTVIECQVLYVNQQFVFKARTSADFVEMWDSQILGLSTEYAIELYGLSGFLRGSLVGQGAGLKISDIGATENLYMDVEATTITGPILIEQTLAGNIFEVSIVGSPSQAGNLTFTAVSAASLTIDGDSIPKVFVTDSYVTVYDLTYAPAISYIPTTLNNWPVSAIPTNVQQALDTLASVHGSNSFGFLAGSSPTPSLVTERIQFIGCVSAGQTVIMPTVASTEFQIWRVKNIGTIACSVEFQPGDSYDIYAPGYPLVLASQQSVSLFSLGTGMPWQTLSS